MSVKKNLPRIVFLDAATVDLGDVDVDSLKRAGSYRAFKDTPASRIVRNAKGADVLLTNKCVLGEEEMVRLPRLKLLCVAATGVNNIDLNAARRLRVAVANVPGYSTPTVSEHALLFLLSLSHRLLEHVDGAMAGDWTRSGSFTLLDFPFSDLEGETLGIIGYGHIGRRVARLARALRMKVRIARLPGRKYSTVPKRFSLRQILASCRFVALHCPLTETTHHLINTRTLSWMRPDAFLLNLARGQIVEEEAVARALLKGNLAGYATDVLSEEPPRRSHPLLDRRLRKKVILTPHIAWASRGSRQRLIDEMAANIRAFKNGRRRNRLV